MVLRVSYLLGISMAYGLRFALFMYAMASKVLLRKPISGRRNYQHAVRLSHGSPLVNVDAINVTANENPPPRIVARSPVIDVVADRVRTVDIYTGNLKIGALWIYIYPDRKIARRVFKVLDRHLASALGFTRYYYDDVQFSNVQGVESIVTDFHALVSKQLDRRLVNAEKARQKERKQAEAESAKSAQGLAPQSNPVSSPSASNAAVVQGSQVPVVSTPPDGSAPSPIKANSAANPVVAQTAPQVQAPAHKRQVKGEAVVGDVTLAGMTTKHGNDGKPYSTYCLTIHDGSREIPFFGTELARQVGDLNIRQGEKIRVVFMGKQSIPTESGAPRHKNLYQITRVGP